MIYTLFIYQSHSGLLIYDKNFQDISQGKMELFSSFFSAIKSFIKELVLDGSKELKNIELGDYTVLITSMNDLKADLVIITDKEDQKSVEKLIPKIIKILMNYQQMFLEWDGSRNEFSLLDQPLAEIMSVKKKLTESTTLIDKPEEFLKTLWAQKGELNAQLQQNLIQERDFLATKYDKAENIPRKLAVAERLLELSEKLKEEKSFLKYQTDVKKLKDEIKDHRLKLKYFLDKAKVNLNDTLNKLGSNSLKSGDYKETYINLYSFSTKLKNMSSGREWEQYRDLAKKLIEKDSIPDHQFSETITSILHMKDDIDSYLT